MTSSPVRLLFSGLCHLILGPGASGDLAQFLALAALWLLHPWSLCIQDPNQAAVRNKMPFEEVNIWEPPVPASLVGVCSCGEVTQALPLLPTLSFPPVLLGKEGP